jgi:hypothetical protein
MAAAAFQNAVAARRSAEAMEASVEEQRLSRWAAFAAVVSFPAGYRYRVQTDGRRTVQISNAHRQPILELRIAMWDMETVVGAQDKLRYSSMLENEPRDVDAHDRTVEITLSPTRRPETERITFGNLAIERFKELTKGIPPKTTLCLITYLHRAQNNYAVFVYDLAPE